MFINTLTNTNDGNKLVLQNNQLVEAQKNIKESAVEEKKIDELKSDISKIKQFIAKFMKQEERLKENRTLENYVQKFRNKENFLEENLFEKTIFLSYIRNGYIPEGYINSNDGNISGITIPRLLEEIILEKMETLSPLRVLCSNIKISKDNYEFMHQENEISAGWSLDSEKLEKPKMHNYIKKSIPLHQIYTRPMINQKMIDNIGDFIEEILLNKISEQIAKTENEAFLFGDGINKPNGILNYSFKKDSDCFDSFGCNEAVRKDAITSEFISEFTLSLKPEFLRNASWLMSRGTANFIRNLKDQNGKFIWEESMKNKSPSFLLGYPVYLSDDMPQISKEEARIPILFGDFKSGYQIVEKGEINVVRDPFSHKPYIEFFTTKKVGADVINFNAIKGMKFMSENPSLIKT